MSDPSVYSLYMHMYLLLKHMSDPRPRLHGLPCERSAVQVRVIVRRPNQDTVPFWSGHFYMRCLNKWVDFKKRAGEVVKGMGGLQHVSVGRSELLGDPNP